MIEINWTIWLQFANFFVLMAVLNVLLYRPLREVMNRRRETVDGSRLKARELEETIAEKMERYRARLQEARSKGAQEKAELRKEAAEKEAAVLGEARQEAADRLQSIKNRIAAEAEEAARALKSEAQTLANQVAGKVLGRSL